MPQVKDMAPVMNETRQKTATMYTRKHLECYFKIRGTPLESNTYYPQQSTAQGHVYKIKEHHRETYDTVALQYLSIYFSLHDDPF